MFKSKITIILCITFGIIALAWKVSLDNMPQSEIVKTSLFPSLIDNINDINIITIEDRKFKTILNRIDGTWYLGNKDNYPALTNGIKRLTLELSNLEVLETKTSSVEKYSKLGVGDLSKENSQASLITLSVDDKNLTSLLVGFTPQGNNKTQRYVRQLNEPTAKLVDGRISVSTNPIDWLDPQIIDLDSKNIKQLRIEVPDQKEIIISKNTGSEDFFALQDIPNGLEVKSKTIVSSIPAVLMDLRLNDVIAAKIFANSDASQKTTISTFDGLKITLIDFDWKGKYYTVFKASLEKPESELVKPNDGRTKAKIDTINKRLEGWAYEIPAYKRRMINRKFADLVKKVETSNGS
jgi:hypothetical protein